jgi:hypothetical protein
MYVCIFKGINLFPKKGLPIKKELDKETNQIANDSMKETAGEEMCPV